MPARPRLKRGDITLQEILTMSLYAYRKKKGRASKDNIDDKKTRSRKDVISAKITSRENMTYNPYNKVWEQTGREAKITFLIRTQPISYVDRSGVRVHKYPVTFLLRSFELGLNSPFRSRVGSLKKPVFPKKPKKLVKDCKTENEKTKVRKELEKLKEHNQKVAKRNVLNQVQLQFFYDSEWVWNAYGLLWGPNYAHRPYIAKDPKRRRNPELIPFFSKHEFFIIQKILNPMLKRMAGFHKDKAFMNPVTKRRIERTKAAADRHTKTPTTKASDRSTKHATSSTGPKTGGGSGPKMPPSSIPDGSDFGM